MFRRIIMNKIINWLNSLSSSMELAVIAYCELDGNTSCAITQIVLENAYRNNCCEIMHKEVREFILDYYYMKEISNEVLLAA